MSRMATPRTRRKLRHLDAAGSSVLAVALSVSLAAAAAVAAPNPPSGKQKSTASEGATAPDLSPQFKGHLPISELTEDQAILHALNRLGYGPRPGDVERVRKMGLEKWIDEQLDPDSIDDSALDKRLEYYLTLKMSSRELLEEFPPPGLAAKQAGESKDEYKQRIMDKRREAMAGVVETGDDNLDKGQKLLAQIQGPNRIVAELSMGKLDRAVYSNRQLEAVMEDFWFNHFNVFAGKGAERWMLTSYVRDTIRPHTMGKFQDLLIATAKSPAMLFYLDNWLSVDPDAYARLQQQMTQLRARYSAFFGGAFPAMGGQLQGQGALRGKPQDRGLNENYGREVMELHTVGVDAGYTQQDVIEMAKCLTGWTVREPRRDPEFLFRPQLHAEGKKTVMGRTFNSGGEKDGEDALKMLASDPRTARFISAALARHFVSDNPPALFVDRMARSYESNGGEIRAVLRTMIYSPEFWSKEAYRAKVKTPFELVASAARALNADLATTLPLVMWVGRMGEPLFLCQPPTGYSDKAQTWVNTGALLNRLNFALALATDHMPGVSVELNPLFGEEAGKDPQMALSRALELFLGNQITPGTRETLEARLGDPQIRQARLDDPVRQVNEGLLSGLVLGAPEFQRR